MADMEKEAARQDSEQETEEGFQETKEGFLEIGQDPQEADGTDKKPDGGPDGTGEIKAEEQKEAEGQEEAERQEETDGQEAAEEQATESSEEEQDSDTEVAAGKEPKASWSERMAAKKQAKQEKKLDPLKERIAELEDRTKRQLAEFENFRKRTDKEKQAMFEIGAKSVIEKILPVVDNFERGLATVPEDRKDDPFVDGMNRVYKQMLTELENIGVKPIEAVGKEFDPKLHNAVMQVTSEEQEPGTVFQELQKGYTYHDSVVRHSMVSVVSE